MTRSAQLALLAVGAVLGIALAVAVRALPPVAVPLRASAPPGLSLADEVSAIEDATEEPSR